MEMDTHISGISTCEKTSKTCLTYINGLGTLSGFTLLVGGVLVKANLEAYTRLFEIGSLKPILDASFAAPTLFIILGCLFIGISLCGYCGATREKVFLLKIYMIFVLIIFVLVLISSILIFAFKPLVKETAGSTLKRLLRSYESSKEIVDLVQTKLSCCGMYSYLDWNNNKAWLSIANVTAEKKSFSLGPHPVPDSCCLIRATQGCGLTRDARVNTNGCANMVKNVISSYGDVVGITGVLVATLLMFCVVFSNCIVKFAERKEIVAHIIANSHSSKQV